MSETRVSKETINRIKEELPSILDENPILSLPAIARKLSISRNSFWKVRTKSKRISNLIEKYMAAKKEDVPKIVRQTWEGRLIAGTAHGSEYMFYMMNHFPEEYQDKRAVVNNTNVVNVDAKVQVEQKFIQSLPEKDLNDLVTGYANRKQVQSFKSRI